MKPLKDYYGIDGKDVRAWIATIRTQTRNVHIAGKTFLTFQMLGRVIYLFSFIAFYQAFAAERINWIIAMFGVYCLLFGAYLITNEK